MKTSTFNLISKALKISALILIFMGSYQVALASPVTPKSHQPDTLTYVQYKGSVIDQSSKDPLPFASLSLEGSNIASITNSEGEFSLKVPKTLSDGKVTISFIGYKNKSLDLSQFKPEKTKIELEMLIVALNEIRVFPKDPELLIRAVMNKRAENYFSDPTTMTTFYRETIKKRKT